MVGSLRRYMPSNVVTIGFPIDVAVTTEIACILNLCMKAFYHQLLKLHTHVFFLLLCPNDFKAELKLWRMKLKKTSRRFLLARLYDVARPLTSSYYFNEFKVILFCFFLCRKCDKMQMQMSECAHYYRDVLALVNGVLSVIGYLVLLTLPNMLLVSSWCYHT